MKLRLIYRYGKWEVIKNLGKELKEREDLVRDL